MKHTRAGLEVEATFHTLITTPIRADSLSPMDLGLIVSLTCGSLLGQFQVSLAGGMFAEVGWGLLGG